MMIQGYYIYIQDSCVHIKERTDWKQQVTPALNLGNPIECIRVASVDHLACVVFLIF